MNIVNVFTEDEHGGETLTHTLLVQNRHGRDSFLEEFEVALEKAMDSGEWDVTEVFDTLRANGWDILDVNFQSVTY